MRWFCSYSSTQPTYQFGGLRIFQDSAVIDVGVQESFLAGSPGAWSPIPQVCQPTSSLGFGHLLRALPQSRAPLLLVELTISTPAVLCLLCLLPPILRDGPPNLFLPCHQAGPLEPSQESYEITGQNIVLS